LNDTTPLVKPGRRHHHDNHRNTSTAPPIRATKGRRHVLPPMFASQTCVRRPWPSKKTSQKQSWFVLFDVAARGNNGDSGARRAAVTQLNLLLSAPRLHHNKKTSFRSSSGHCCSSRLCYYFFLFSHCHFSFCGWYIFIIGQPPVQSGALSIIRMIIPQNIFSKICSPPFLLPGYGFSLFLSVQYLFLYSR